MKTNTLIHRSPVHFPVGDTSNSTEKIVFILGDVHGDFGMLNEFINRKIRQQKVMSILASECDKDGKELEVIILQVGDMAFFWPGYYGEGQIKNKVDFLKNGLVKIYWCAGNHEDHDELDMLFKPGSFEDMTGMAQVDDGITFCRFGSTLELTPEITVLFAGGAESIDKQYRLQKMLEGYPKIWWEQEGVSEVDLERLEVVPKADWVISHSAPMAFNLNPWLANNGFEPTHQDELSRYKLDNVLWKYQPKRWYFGHFHRHMEGVFGECQWEGLADMRSQETYWQSMRLD